MKNSKIIFISLIVSFLLYLGFEISAGKINFGSAWWSDTLSNRITTNKAINLRPGDSLYYNGNVVTSGTSPAVSIDTTKYLTIYNLDTGNIGMLNQPQSWTELNTFGAIAVTTSIENLGSTTLADLILTGNADISGNNRVTGFSSLGASSPSIKMKMVRGKITATGADLNMPHGLTDYKKIRGLQLTVLRDTTGTTNRVLSFGYDLTTPLNVGFRLSVDTTNIIYRVQVNSTALLDDSVRVLITYEE